MNDAVVVGCGIIGASVAWRLSQVGLSVTCLDPTPGDGATFAAAGMLAPVTEAEFGDAELTGLNLESAREWPGFAAELAEAAGTELGFGRTGTLTVAYDAGDRQELRRLMELRAGLGLATEEVSVDAARAMEPLLGPRIAGAAWTPDEHQVDPRRVHAALLAVLAARGVEVVRRRVVALAEQSPGGPVTGAVDDQGTTHSAGVLVLAAGWASRELTPSSGGYGAATTTTPTRPVKGQVLRLDAGPESAFSLGRVVRGFVQSRQVYLVPRADGEVVVGATSEEQPDDRRVTAGGAFGILRDARALVPGIDELPLVELTARARPGSPDNLPMIGGSGRPGLVLATGHYRNGILLAPLTAAAITAYVRDGAVPAWAAAADPRRFVRAVGPRRLAPTGGRP
ncbi:glycine oxidase ThiO [Jiangella asiatica]|uniref:glycine oxidase n=1 Tax=Jiangella asiatica TaxID=2530372 RepID=A0A4R5DDQ4_9ACTN|nr:glycine oxidase ThiO [Jiangella asiatica]TDE10090.1 glycine oxidase ThiO [Jiangella asiatica]